jgi:hypothetical protein
MITFLGMYKNMDNEDTVMSILSRPEFQGSVRSADDDPKRKQGLAEIYNLGEWVIYEYLKKAYSL